MGSWESIIISGMFLTLSGLIFVTSVDGNGILNIGESIGIAGILVFFFLTLNFIITGSEKVDSGK